MGKQQRTLMTHHPAYGFELAEPTDAWAWRKQHENRLLEWAYNPWTGEPRSDRAMATDPYGILIVPPGEPLYAADGTNNHMDPPEFPTLAVNVFGNPAEPEIVVARALALLRFIRDEVSALIVALEGPGKKP